MRSTLAAAMIVYLLAVLGAWSPPLIPPLISPLAPPLAPPLTPPLTAPLTAPLISPLTSSTTSPASNTAPFSPASATARPSLALASSAVLSEATGIAPLPLPEASLSATTVSRNPILRPELPILGFAVSFHHTEDFASYLQAIDRMATLGANSVQIVTPAFQQDGAATQIRIDEDRGPTRRQIVQLLTYAKDRGMVTSLMPIVLFTHPRGNEWRGKLHPTDWPAWWRSYRRMIDHFLDIAIEAQVDQFSVGSELLSTETQSESWNAIIGHVRQAFPGRLYYSTNWDHFHVPTFWNKLDLIGISAYWDLTLRAKDKKNATDAELAQRWEEIRQEVIGFSQARRQPLLITELGYPSLPWAVKDPWNYVNSAKVKADHAAQMRGYRSFLQAWNGELKPLATSADPSRPRRALAGVYFYSWEPWGHGDDQDTGYGIQGKPAMKLIERWLNDYWTAAIDKPAL